MEDFKVVDYGTYNNTVSTKASDGSTMYAVVGKGSVNGIVECEDYNQAWNLFNTLEKQSLQLSSY